jgi:hypothetical protein
MCLRRPKCKGTDALLKPDAPEDQTPRLRSLIMLFVDLASEAEEIGDRGGFSAGYGS